MVPADEGVAKPAGEEPGPRDEQLGVTPPEVRLQGEIHDAHEESRGKTVAEALPERAIEGARREGHVAHEEVAGEDEAEDDHGQADGARLVATSKPEVAPREVESRDGERQRQKGEGDVEDLRAKRDGSGRDLSGLAPGRDQLEVDGAPFVDRGDDLQNGFRFPGEGSRPARHGVERDGRHPCGLGGRERLHVEAGLREECLPRRRFLGRRAFPHLSRDGEESSKLAARVEHHRDHSRDVHRGVVPPDFAAEIAGHEWPRALPIPEGGGRPPRRGELPSPAGRAVLGHPQEKRVVADEGARGVGGRVRPAESYRHLAGAIRERVGGLLRGRETDVPPDAGKEENGDEKDDDTGEERPRRAGGERPFFSGRRDHLGRRRLARREGRRERVAARERAGDLHGRRRPRARVLLEAAQDHALDGRVEAREDVRGRRRRLLLVLAAHLGEVGRVERPLAGRDLVEDEAERIEIAPHGRRLAGELLRRHVRGRARDLAQRSRFLWQPPRDRSP